MAILRAIDKMQFPKRPKELLDTSVRSNDIWALLMACWDHDPAARPEAWHVLSTVSAFLFLSYGSRNELSFVFLASGAYGVINIMRKVSNGCVDNISRVGVSNNTFFLWSVLTLGVTNYLALVTLLYYLGSSKVSHGQNENTFFANLYTC